MTSAFDIFVNDLAAFGPSLAQLYPHRSAIETALRAAIDRRDDCPEDAFIESMLDQGGNAGMIEALRTGIEHAIHAVVLDLQVREAIGPQKSDGIFEKVSASCEAVNERLPSAAGPFAKKRIVIYALWSLHGTDKKPACYPVVRAIARVLKRTTVRITQVLDHRNRYRDESRAGADIAKSVLTGAPVSFEGVEFSDSYQTKVTKDVAIDVCRRVKSGEKGVDVANSLGIAQSTVSAIVCGKRWKEAQMTLFSEAAA